MSKGHAFHKRILNFIHQERLWQPGDSLVLSVSGGVDSMVLLDVLIQSQPAHQGKIQVVTFDHGLREESAQECAFVKEMCDKESIPCEIFALHMHKGSHFQEIAREHRRAILESFEGSIVTGHHCNDQAETILFRLLRGTGLTGLRGILPKQGRWVHPLLFLMKSEIIDYAKSQELHWFEDLSNPTSTRGKIRELWPHLAKIREFPMKSLAQSGRLLALDEDFFREQMLQYWKECIRDFEDTTALSDSEIRKLHPSLQVRLIKELAQQFGLSPTGAQLESFLTWHPISKTAHLPFGRHFQLQRQNGLLYFVRL